jgi:hypothetical protein
MCGAKKGGVSTEGLDLTDEAVVQGVVTRDGEPVANAYVRLLDGGGEFTAELPTDDAGRFRFFAAPGDWTLRTLAPRSEPFDTTVTAAQGQIVEVVIDLPV